MDYREGRVEIYYNNEWNMVCDDGWDDNDTAFVCHMLGHPGTEGSRSQAAFGEETGEIILDNVECDGSEDNILQCPHNGLFVGNCGHSEDAEVVCSHSGTICILYRIPK